jgi:hypothetical protein
MLMGGLRRPLAAAGGVWHLLVRAGMHALETTLAADEAMPDPDPQRIRGLALPRIATSVTTTADGPARFEEMPDPFGT